MLGNITQAPGINVFIKIKNVYKKQKIRKEKPSNQTGSNMRIKFCI